ncbi:MAG: phosphoglycerate dehydrogenase, partial [Myxococcota bacterium]
MAATRVLVSDKLSQSGLAALRDHAEIQVDYLPELSPQELLQTIGDYEGLVIRSGTKVTADVIAKAVSLRVVGRAGIGVD